MLKLYFKYSPDFDSITDTNVRAMLDSYRYGDARVRVIVKDDNFDCPVVQFAEYDYDVEEPWKSDYWMTDETKWDGIFTPDDSWTLVVLDK